MLQSPLRSKPATIALLNLGLCSAVVYAALQLRYPLVSLYANQRNVLKDYTESDPTTGTILLLGLVVVFACYALGAFVVRRIERVGRAAALTILTIPVICGLVIFLTQPITSTDLYDYLFRGRMIAHYGANTFITAPNAYTSDPLFPYVVWRNAVSAYGPLWEGMSWLASRLAGETFGGAPQPNDPALFKLIMAYKLIEVIGWLLCGGAIWAALGRIAPQHRWLGMFLWLWNPMVLWETLAAGHNDVWMVLPIVLAVWAFGAMTNSEFRIQNSELMTTNKKTRRSIFTLSPVHLVTLSLTALTIGGLIKYLALILGPLVLLAGLRLLPTWRQRAWLVFGGGALCAGLIILSYAPFWVGKETLINFDHRKHLANSSWLAALRPILAERTTMDEAKATVTTIGTFLLLVGIAWFSWRSWRVPQRLISHMTWLLLWFLFVCNPWYQPWYAMWLLPLVALQPERRRLVWATLLFSFTGMLGYYATTFVLPKLGLEEVDSGWHALLTALIYIPPLLIPVVYIIRRLAAPPATGTRSSLRLWLYGAGMSSITIAFALCYSLAGNAGQLTDIGKLSGYGWTQFAGYVVGIGSMFVLYTLAARESRFVERRTALTVIFTCGLVMALALVLMYPVNAIDTFLYAARSRLISAYGVNPNSVLLASFPNDPWLPFATDYWANRPSPYGPLWNVLAAPITAISGTNMAAAVVGFKLLSAVALLAGGAVLAQLATGDGRWTMGGNSESTVHRPSSTVAPGATGALVYLWNPLVLWEGVGNGHNDVLIALFLLLALLAWQRRHHSLVIPLLVAAALVKYVTLPLLPIAAVALWRRASGNAERRRIGWQSVLACLVLVLVSLFPFYEWSSLLTSVQQQNDLFYTSPTSVAVALLQNRYPTDVITNWVSLLGMLLLALIVVWQTLRVWRDPEQIGRAWFEVLFVLILVGLASSRAWYIIWLVALAALFYPGWPWRRTLAWCIGGLASYAFFIWIEAWLQPGYDRAQIIGTVLMLGPPLFVTCLEFADRTFSPPQQSESPVVVAGARASARR